MADHNTVIVEPSSDACNAWDSFVDGSPQGCIFCKSWWLEAVCPGAYRFLLAEKGGRILGGMPLIETRKWGIRAIHMPRLTQTLGILLAPQEEAKGCTRLSDELRVIRDLVAAIPPVHYFAVNFHPAFTNWLPLYWRGYQQTTRYTYVIRTEVGPVALWDALGKKTRKTIRKAEKQAITICRLDDVDVFLDMNKKTFSRQGLRLPYSEQLVRRLTAVCMRRDAGRMHVARDPQGRIHCATYVVFDHKTMYALMSGSDPELRASGAHALAKWQSICMACDMGLSFDFEGSMIEDVERFNRGFGAHQVPYFHISKIHPVLALGRDIARWLRQRRPVQDSQE